MDGQVAQVCLPSHFLLELVSPVENSSPEVAELRAEVHRLQAENLKLRQQAGYWKSRHRDALNRITAEMADVVFRALRGGRRQGPGECPAVLAVEPERSAKEGVRERRTPSRG